MHTLVVLLKKKLVLFCFLYQLICATQYKSGIISRDEYWTAENNPYIITNDILVSVDARLVIAPGVKIEIESPTRFIEGIIQHDRTDSLTTALTVEGGLKCIGRINNRISFSSSEKRPRPSTWYGIVITSNRNDNIEIAHTDIFNACIGITIYRGDCTIRNSLLEYNNIAIFCTKITQPHITNCIISHNATAGIKIQQANPIVQNSIFFSNFQTALWSDNISRLTIAYNCFFNNLQNFSGCGPELGIILKKKYKKKDVPHDISYNIYMDPIFAGSASDSIAVEQDITLPTDASRIFDTSLAQILHDTLLDSSAQKKIKSPYKPYEISSYSPCIDRGNPAKKFKDTDGTTNDIGIYGGSDFAEE